MDKEQALKQIEEMSRLISASNRYLFCGPQMMFYGVLVMLIPVIEKYSVYLTFGYDFNKFGMWSPYVVCVIHIVFYWTLFSMFGKIVVQKFGSKNKLELHPLIHKAFRLYKPIVFSIFGIILMLAPMGEPGRFILPFVLILVGILFNLYGRFSLKIVSWISWSYIFLGLVYGHLTQYEAARNMWMFITTYWGLSYIVMGYYLHKETRNERAQ